MSKTGRQAFSVKVKSKDWISEHDYEYTVYVENGNIVKLYVRDVSYWPMTYDHSHNSLPTDERFERELQICMRAIFKHGNDYRKFVEALNSELLEKYFERLYIPKEIV